MTDPGETSASEPDRLVLDISNDLARVDPVMTRIVGDPVVAEEFIRDPSGVLTRFGFHPRTTRSIHDRVNRVFYAVLTNTELLELLAEHNRTFGTTGEASLAAADTRERMAAALERGELENSLDYDLAALRHLIDAEDVLRRAFQLTLHDLNNRRILLNVYATEDIDRYVDEVTTAIRERRALREFPVLEKWDNNYGIGNGYGGLFLEVGAAVTTVGYVEVGAYTTVWVETDTFADVILRPVLSRAAAGDPNAARALATTGALFRLAGEVMIHANNFERRSQ